MRNAIINVTLFLVLAIVLDYIHMRINLYLYYKVVYKIKTYNETIVKTILVILNGYLFVMRKIPYLFFDNSILLDNYELLNHEIQDFSNKFNCSPNLREKIWMLIEGILKTIKYVLKFRLAYIFIIAYIVLRVFKDWIINQYKLIYEQLPNIFVSSRSILMQIFKMIQANGITILVIFIILLFIYVRHLKRKKEYLSIEEVWKNEENNNISEVACILKENQILLFDIANIVDKNNAMLCKLIRSIEFFKMIHRYKDEDASFYKTKFHNEIFDDLTALGNYRDKIDEIKDKIKDIEELNGRNAYLEYHKKIWGEFTALYLMNSSKSYIMLSAILCVDKDSVIESVNREFKNYNGIELVEEVQKLIRVRWIEGLDYINSINKYLNHAYKRKVRYQRLEKKIKIATELNEVSNEIKDKIG